MNCFTNILGNDEYIKQYTESITNLYSGIGYSLNQRGLKLFCFNGSIFLLIGYFKSLGWCEMDANKISSILHRSRFPTNNKNN